MEGGREGGKGRGGGKGRVGKHYCTCVVKICLSKNGFKNNLYSKSVSAHNMA